MNSSRVHYPYLGVNMKSMNLSLFRQEENQESSFSPHRGEEKRWIYTFRTLTTTLVEENI